VGNTGRRRYGGTWRTTRQDTERHLKNDSNPNIREMAALNLQKMENGNCNAGNKTTSQDCTELNLAPTTPKYFSATTILA